MKSLWSGFVSWVPLLLLAAVLTRLGALAQWSDIPAPVVSTDCQVQPMRIVIERFPRSVADTPRGSLLTLPAVLEGTYCKPGELRLRAEPAGTGEVPAIVSLSLNGRPVLSRVIRSQQIVTLPISAPGRISVAFLNQTYQLDARMITLLQVLPKGQAQCPGPWSGEVPMDSGTWDGTQGRLYGGAPLHLPMCGKGSVLLQLQGQASGGGSPILRLGGVTPIRELVVPTTLSLSVPIDARGRLSLQLVNPRAVSQTNSRVVVQPVFHASP